ncbi:OadG family transporter subunit [Romboutsia sp.]|uniref:OadG family transporter subunit n=1 Tax=Romboutsia sp. TaxID=1965302 RepID=UPI003F4093E1
MNISQLLEALKDTPVNLSVGEKLIAGFSVTVLSMVVVFIVLVLIAWLISLLQKEKEKEKETVETKENTSAEKEDIGELVSVITAAICAATGNSSNNIVVRKIVRSNNSKSSWQSMKKN